jgi:hypothetical protein
MTRHEIARRYGYKLRSTLDADFISLKDGHPQYGTDDLMRIAANGEITLYADDANAYFVASLIRNTPK